MAIIVNLRQRRKRQAKAQADAQAAENRQKFGQPKAEKNQRKLETAHGRKALDAHRLPNGGDKNG
jgi:Domain of unknown function (DUF4169)